MYRSINVLITNDVYDSIFVDSLKELYRNFLRSYHRHIKDDADENNDWPRVYIFKNTPEEDKEELQKHLEATQLLLSYYLTTEDYKNWQNRELPELVENLK